MTINTAFEDTGVDILLGSGGAPEGVIAAVGLKCLGGELQGRSSPGERGTSETMRENGYWRYKPCP